MKRLFGAIAFAFLVVAAPARTGHADPPHSGRPDMPDAQRLFLEAKELILQGKWDAACPKLAASNQADPRHTTLYRLAECYEHTAKPASAWAAYRAAAKAAAAGGEATRAEYATGRAARLEPSLSHVLLTVRDAPPGLSVEWDGVALRESDWNTKVPADPGQHVLSARAPWKVPYTAKVDVPADRSTVVVLLPPLETEKPGPTMPGHVPTGILSQRIEVEEHNPPKPPPVEEKPKPAPNSLRVLRPWGIGLGALGLGAAGLGTGLIVSADPDPNRSCAGSCVSGAVVLAGGGAIFALGVAFILASLGGEAE